MNRCFRCSASMPEPDLLEAIALEADWREYLKENPLAELDERVLICLVCAEELEEIEDE